MTSYVYILGVPNFANYESSAALIRVPSDGGEIDYVCIAEDRLSRAKHTYTFPLLAIDYCLKHFGLERLGQLDFIATDYARIPRWANSGPAYRKLENDYVKAMLDFPPERILIVDHHDAHAASCYYPSGFDEAGVLVVDGMGSELNTQTAYHFQGNTITWHERGFDWGIGKLYSLITGAVLPYGPEKGYGKVMGLAAYGEGSDAQALSFGAKGAGMTTDYSHFYTRFPISRLVARDVPQCQDRQEVMQDPFPRIAYEVQEECEKEFLRFANYIHEKTGTRHLCISGGVALNGRANYRILQETPIENVWIQPACSDTGIPFGAALWAAFQIVQKESVAKRCFVKMDHAYCGSKYSPAEVDALLDQYEVERRPVTNREVAQLIADGHIVAVFEGESEYGPRALGHRSILTDPRDPNMKDRLNRSVKFRETYRPYAPVVLRECVSDYFEFDAESPFMLLVADVRKDKYDVIPAVTHVDGTARVQTVTAEANRNYYDIVHEFYDITNVPVLLNTSFNVNREPIVETPLDSLICAFGTSIDYLVIEGRLVDCAPYRRPELVQELRASRQAHQEQEKQRIRAALLHRYDPEEIERYLHEENLIADWYKQYRAKYEMEKCMVEWAKRSSHVLVVGTRNHTKCLYLYIPGFPAIQVTGFVPCDEYEGERGAFQGVYDEYLLDDVPWDQVDVVLISSHEHQRDIEARVAKVAPEGTPILSIYDSACDSLIFTLPGRWPVMNPNEALRHELSMDAQAQRTASNIDFDFEPIAIDIGERYGAVINYHYVRPNGDHPYPVDAAVTPDSFLRHLAQLRENFTFCQCRDLVDPDLELPESNVVISFDDGARDIIEHAAPVLKRLGVPATFFVCSQPFTEGRLLDVHKIQLLMRRLGLTQFSKAFYAEHARRFPRGMGAERESVAYAGDYQFYRYGSEAMRAFKMDLNYLIPYDQVGPVLDELFRVTFGHDVEASAVREIYLGKDDLKRLVDDGFEVGVHGHDHRVLPRLSYEEQRRSLERAADFLAGEIGQVAKTVAYPYGFFDDDTKRAMNELGFVAGFGMGREVVTPSRIHLGWGIPRFDVVDCFDPETDQIKYEVFSTLSTGG